MNVRVTADTYKDTFQLLLHAVDGSFNVEGKQFLFQFVFWLINTKHIVNIFFFFQFWKTDLWVPRRLLTLCLIPDELRTWRLGSRRRRSALKYRARKCLGHLLCRISTHLRNGSLLTNLIFRAQANHNNRWQIFKERRKRDNQ